MLIYHWVQSEFVLGGGDGCHRGLENIIYQLGTNKFSRIRLGIATDEQMRPSEKYVLKPFNKDKQNVVKEMIQCCSNVFQSYIKFGAERTMNHFLIQLERRNSTNG